MSVSSSQPSLDLLSGRRFSFYPAIRGIEHNEWGLTNETWSEILVTNVETNLELWVPRKYVSGISSSDSPVLIVGLNRELQFQAGSVWPYREKIVSIPDRRPASERDPAASAASPSAPSRSSSPSESQLGRLIAVALAVGVLACMLAVMFIFEGVPNPIAAFFRPDTKTSDQRYLSLAGSDRFNDAALKIGPPSTRQWISREDSQIQFELLWYPDRSYIVVLMGASRDDARYIGTLHARSREVLDSVKLSGGGTTGSMLHNLPGF
jgi:hypothetical protein